VPEAANTVYPVVNTCAEVFDVWLVAGVLHMDKTQEHRHYGFAIGLLTGAFVGAGLALWLAPRGASELGERLTDSARSLGERASERLHEVNARVGEAVDELTRTGQGVRDEVAGVVARSAREVERFATASSTQSRS
jgi:gas vesicle protein